jgi:hypothetical protein
MLMRQTRVAQGSSRAGWRSHDAPTRLFGVSLLAWGTASDVPARQLYSHGISDVNEGDGF